MIARVQPERILVAGDSHHDIDHWTYLCETALEQNCDFIHQVGDFGWLPHRSFGEEFIAHVAETLDNYNLVATFNDGNHDNFDSLWASEWPIVDGFYRLQPRLFYAPRGLRWLWRGIRFMSLGGAYSMDKHMRLRAEARAGLPRFHYWPQEVITQGDMYRAIGPGGHVDIMFTHDCPFGVVIPNFATFARRKESYQNRMALREVVCAVKPKRLYHGHLHYRYQSTLIVDEENVNCHIEGLGMNGQVEKSWTVLDLNQFRGEYGF